MKGTTSLTHQKSNVSVLLSDKISSSPKSNLLKIISDFQNPDSVLSPIDPTLSRQASKNKLDNELKELLTPSAGMEKLKKAVSPMVRRMESIKDVRKMKGNQDSDYLDLNSIDKDESDLLVVKKSEPAAMAGSRLILTKSHHFKQALKKIENSSFNPNLSPNNQLLTADRNRSSITQKGRPTYSYLRHHLTFIPDNLSSYSERNDNKSPFRSFDDLARTTTNRYPKMLENILLTHENESKSSKSSLDTPENNLENIKTMLKFNKLQKNYYEAQTVNTQISPVFNPRATFSNLKPTTPTPKKSQVTVSKVNRPKRLKAITFAGSESEENSPRHAPKEEKETQGKPNYFFSDSIRDGATTQLAKTMTNGTPPLPDHFGKNWKFYWHSANRESGSWKPDASEGQTITNIGDVLITYGGIGNKVTNILASYNPVKDTWAKIDARGDIPLRGRHGHSACQFEGNLIIFGGELKFNEELKFRECSNDMYIFSLERKQWKWNKTEGKIIEPRRNHSAVIHNKQMFVYGGVSIEGSYMKDLWCFNFKTNHWKQIKAEGNKECGQAFHSMSACFNQKSLHNEPQVTEPGIYVFGGKDDDGIILDSLKVLKISGSSYEWKYPVTKGPYPPARYGHSMVFHDASNILIIHGGRNDYLYASNQDICLNDFRILNLLEMKWSVASSFGDPCPTGRWHHSMTMFKSALVIFGGLGFNTYLNPEMKFIETDQYVVRKLIKDQKTKKEISFAERLSRTINPKNDELGTNIMKVSSTPYNGALKPANFRSYKPIPTQEDMEGEDGNSKRNVKSKIKNMILKNGFSEAVKALAKSERGLTPKAGFE